MLAIGHWTLKIGLSVPGKKEERDGKTALIYSDKWGRIWSFREFLVAALHGLILAPRAARRKHVHGRNEVVLYTGLWRCTSTRKLWHIVGSV